MKVASFLPLLVLVAPSASAEPVVGSHTWDFTEVFSDATGNVQFIELAECCGGMSETGLPGHTLSSNANSLVIPGPALTPPTSNRSYLIATAAFAALAGAPTPDAIMPANFLSTAGDTLTYVPWDTWTFGAIPTDGVNSLKRGGAISLNDPTNYAGTSGTIGVPAPTLPLPLTVALAALLVAGGTVLLVRRAA